MRTLNEIQKDIDIVKNQEQILLDRRKELNEEYRQTLQANFEQKHNLKTGDLIQDRKGNRYYYVDVVRWYGWACVRCHTVRKDGSESKVETKPYMSEFDYKGEIKVNV